jgi:hypothetical protein
MADAYNRAAFDMLVANRGGIPATCDFCRQPFTEARWPVPEEGRAWACSECEAGWIKEENNA